MKMKYQNSPIFTLLTAVVFSVFYGCEKNPMENFKITVSPALFEYTASIRIIDAADSTVPPNLKIVLSPENEGYLYDILGKNKLEISEDGYISVGLKPSLKPNEDNPVEVLFQLQADNYISESYSLVFNKDEFVLEKTYALMNKSNLPEGIFYTEFKAEIIDGLNTKDIVIELGSDSIEGTLKSASAAPLNTATIKAGTKWVNWNKQVLKWSGTVDCDFWINYSSVVSLDRYSNGFTKTNGISKAIGTNSRMGYSGAYELRFRKDGWETVYPTPGATLQLSVPKWGYNVTTEKLFQNGNVINIFNFNPEKSGPKTYEFANSQTLSATSNIDSKYFKLKPFDLGNVNRIIVGNIVPVVLISAPKIRIEGDNTPPNNLNVSSLILQQLYKEFNFMTTTKSYLFGYDEGRINFSGKQESYPVFTGNFSKTILYSFSKRINNTDQSIISYESLRVKNLMVGQGQPNPFDFTIPSGKTELVNISFSVKCGTTVIKPTFSYYTRHKINQNDDPTSFGYGGPIGYIKNGKGSSYYLKVGCTYAFKIFISGKTIETVYKITSANTEIVIEDNSFCTF